VMTQVDEFGLRKIKRALVSVSDKTGIIDFARALAEFGVEIISTGGTARALRDVGLEVVDISDVTGFPEMMDGRVKTLHPRVHGGLLALRDNPEHVNAMKQHGINPIDMVVVNLYPFAETIRRPEVTREEAIEQIDIGGPAMIRSAAKNAQDVAVVVSSSSYDQIIDEIKKHDGALSLATRERLAYEAFQQTADYDFTVSAYLGALQESQTGVSSSTSFTIMSFPKGGSTSRNISDPDIPDDFSMETFQGSLPAQASWSIGKLTDLRYGENPHQIAALYQTSLKEGLANAQILSGKEMSFNNYIDADAAWQLVTDFDETACAIIKHTNPCGCAEQSTLSEAYRKAFEADPVSAYGGVIGINRPIDGETATEIAKTFIEAIAAPDYSPEALAVLGAKKNLRLMRVAPGIDPLVVKSISGGYLAQTADLAKLNREAAVVKTQRAPTEEEWVALEFGWKVAKHVKSNAIVYARAGQSVGVGAGQMSRVDSVKIGAMKAVLPLGGTVVASDAFFPFADGLEEAVKNGATAFIQPGGSVRDVDVIAAADRLGVAMVFAGIRHFRH